MKQIRSVQSFLLLYGMLCHLLFVNVCYAAEEQNNAEIPRPVKKIINKYSDAIQDAAKKNALRMAVTPFVSTNDMPGDKNSFGTYFAEMITSALIDNVKNVRLIERTRLDAITKENALSLSGLISENDARKVGELLPIDYILTGTYTVLGTDLTINARFVNVITGEIAFSKNDQLRIPDELKGIFPVISVQKGGVHNSGGSSGTSDPGKHIDECEEIENGMFDKAGSAGPSQYTQVLIKEGIKVPFDTKCGRVHSRIIDYCVKNHINTPEYTTFLIKCADTMDLYWSDNRGSAIMRYFAADSLITADEWKTSLMILTKMDYSAFGNSIRSLVFYEEQISDVQKDRYTQLLKQCAAGQIGKKPVGVARLLEDMVDITGARFQHPNRIQGKKYERSDISRFESLQTLLAIADPFLADTAANEQVEYLQEAWKYSTDKAVSQNAFTLLCKKMALVKKLRVNDIRLLVNLADDLTDSAYKDEEDIIRQSSIAFKQMSMLGESCKKLLEQQLKGETIFTNQLQDLLPFCLYNGIELSGVPPIDTLKYWLAGEDTKGKRVASDYIVYMGKRAAPLESNIIRAIRKGIHTQPQPFFDRSLIVALGILGTNSEETRTLLVDCLARNDAGYMSSKPIILAIAQCGPSIIPLVKNYFAGDHWNRFGETLEIIKIMGKDASGLFAPVLSFANTCDNPKLKYEAQETIDAIRNKN